MPSQAFAIRVRSAQSMSADVLDPDQRVTTLDSETLRPPPSLRLQPDASGVSMTSSERAITKEMAMGKTGRDKPGGESRPSGSRHTTSRQAGRPGKRQAAAPQAHTETAGPAETVTSFGNRAPGHSIPDAADLSQKMAEIAR